MKNSFKQGKSFRYILFGVIAIIFISLSLFALTACQEKLDIESIYIKEETIPQNLRVSELNLSDITLVVLDSQGAENTVALSPTMLSTDSRNKLTTGGEHNITVRYHDKSTTFTIRVFNDNDELVEVTFKDRNNNIITTIVTVKGGSLTPPPYPIEEGMIPDGWLDMSNNEVRFSAVNDSMEVKAKYIKDARIHTVTFKDHTGEIIDTIQVEHGNRLPDTPNYEAPEGTASWDWYYGNSKLDIENLVISQNIVLNVKLEGIKHTVTYFFITNDGNRQNLGSEQVQHNGAATGAQIARDSLYDYGYNFKRWLTTAFQSVKMDLDVQAEVSIFTYTVTFLDYKGDTIDTITVNHGGNIDKAQINQPTEYDGHIFTDEWIGGSLTNIQKNLEFSAVYVPKKLKIQLYDNLGQDPEAIFMDYGTTIDAENLQELKEREGCILLGLYKDMALEDNYVLPYTIFNDTSFYIKWLDTINGNNELTYNIEDDYSYVTGYEGKDALIYIPSSYNGFPVRMIESDSFKNKDIHKISFGSNLKEIGDGAFENTKLSGLLELPSGLTKIGNRAFANCVDLESVRIPDSVIELNQSAFEGAINLKQVFISDQSNLRSLGDGAFRYCQSLTTINLKNIETIGDDVFESASLISIDLQNARIVGKGSFRNNITLTEVTFGSIEEIEQYAFAETAIEQLNISTLVSIESYAFADCSRLLSASIYTATLQPYTFSNCISLSEVELMSGLVEVEDYAFNNCSSITSIEFPDSLSSISAIAFNGMHKLEEILVNQDNNNFISVEGVLYNLSKTTMIAYPSGRILDEFIVPETVFNIGDNAFENAIIARLVLPLDLQTLGKKALYSRFISTIEFRGDIPNIDQEENIVSDSLWKLYVQSQYLDNFHNTNIFAMAEETPVPFVAGSMYDEDSGLVYIIEDRITIVAADRTRTNIIIPERIDNKSVRNIAAYAFENCDKLQRIEVRGTIYELGEYAFRGCTNLSEIIFNSVRSTEDLTDININAFEDTPWYIHNDLIIMATIAIEYKLAIDNEGKTVEKTSLIIPSHVEVLAADLFNNDAGRMLSNISLPPNLKVIQARAFYGSNITSIDVSSQLNKIEESAFENCYKLKTINIYRSSLSTIPQRAFANCSLLEEVRLPLNVATIGTEAFYNNTSLRQIILPDSLIQIGDKAFKGCISMPTVDIPLNIGKGLGAGEIAIGNEAFQNCNSLVYVRMWNPTPPLIGQSVFSSGAYIYVESSDGETIKNNYKSVWTDYDPFIREQHDSPRVTFVANKDSQGDYVDALKGIILEPARVSVLYEEDMPELPMVSGYLFVCWTYEVSSDNWIPIEYPFLISNNTTLLAKWVRIDEGSLNDNDLYENIEMQGYELRDYTGSDTKVVIPSDYKGKPIIMITDEAFKGNTQVTEIIFLESSNIKYILKEAFANLPNLRSIILPSSLLVIEDDAFANCINLEYIYIPKSVKSIGLNAFANCSNLDIEFEAGSELRYAEIESFSDTLWYENQKDDEFANFVIAGRLVIEYLKKENQNLVAIPVRATALKQELFFEDTDLVTVELHANIEFIGDRCFYNCSSLVSVDFGSLADSQIEYVGEDAFFNTPWKDNQDVFVQVGGVLIEYRGSNMNVNLPDTITAIEEYAFAYKAIKSIVLPRNLKTIANKAFYNCNNLEYIEIPSQVTYIGEEAFAQNTSLKHIVFLGNNLREVGQGAFEGCTSLGVNDDLILPSSLTILGKKVFNGCSSLRGIDLERTMLTQLSTNLFEGANNLVSITLPSTLVSIGNNAFAGCAVLEHVTIAPNSSLKQISLNAFEDTAWYLKVSEQEDSLIYLGSIFLKFRARIGGIKNKAIIIPDSIKYIAPRAFEEANLVSVQFPDGLIEIGEKAFYRCSQITNIIIPDSTEKIGSSAFANCKKLETVSLGAELKEVGTFAFADCAELYKVTINRMGFRGLSENKQAEIISAINTDTLTQWLQANPGTFTGTELIEGNAFAGTEPFLRIYVVRDSLDINGKLYLEKWYSLAGQIYNAGDLPTVSFVQVEEAENIPPVTTEYLTEADINAVWSEHTLLGWKTEGAEGEKISLPYRVTGDITLEPMWLENNRPDIEGRDEALGFTYAANLEQTGFFINSYVPDVDNDLLVIPSKVQGNSLIGINDDVFTVDNTQHIKTIMITKNDNLALLNKNIFNMFTNLERIIVDGKDFATLADYYNYTDDPIGASSRYISVEGILYTKDLKTLIAFPRAKTSESGNLLTSFEIPSRVEVIVDYAFSGSSLISLHIPDSVIYVGEGAFNGNYSVHPNTNAVSGLKYITFAPSSEIREVAYEAFNDTVWYKDNTDSFKVAGSYLLDYQGYSDRVVIPNHIKTIGIRAFRNNDRNNITRLTIPSSVVRINQEALISCSNIVDIIFETDSQLMDVAHDVFKATNWLGAMNNGINEFIIAGNVLIKYLSGKESISLPTEVKVIGYDAFNNATLKEIDLHNGLERIDENAFYGANFLQSITIPSSVRTIGDNAFHSCMALGEVIFGENSNLTELGTNAFAYCQTLNEIAIPDSVLKIGDNAFDYCTGLTTAEITEDSQLEFLGSNAFKNAQSLTYIYIPNGLREIKASTFENCTALLKFGFSSSNKKLVRIGENAFKGCTLLGSDLEGRTNLLTVELPQNVNTIEDGAFSGCKGMYGIWMNKQILRIGKEAFSGCSNLANITIFTTEPPIIEENTFNYNTHPNVRVYVNIVQGQSVRDAYRGAWGDERVAKSDNIFERSDLNKPLVKFYDYTSGGEEQHIEGKDINTELLSEAILPTIIHSVKGIAIGFYKDINLTENQQVCTDTRPFEILHENVVKIYVRWESS